MTFICTYSADRKTRRYYRDVDFVIEFMLDHFHVIEPDSELQHRALDQLAYRTWFVHHSGYYGGCHVPS